jgi:hypothetical protein
VGVDLRKAKAPGVANLSNGVGRNLVGPCHLQNAPGFNLEEPGDYFFINEGFKRGNDRLGEIAL